MEGDNNSVKNTKTYVIDESGFLVNSSLLNAEIQDESRDERMGTDPLPYVKRSKFKKHSMQSGLKNTKGNKIPGSFKKKSKEIPRHRELVKCPLCKHKTEYNVLFVHIQVSHPQINPKILMAKFNKAYRNSHPDEKIRDELDEMEKDYEKFKQSQDESRDGGKYLGYMKREHGKFGSLPLYDDYSDDASAD